ncbi:hypothetical protein AYI70_g1474 [Smittium culicis]|uniref:Uncharacterized protein n=1 Tax=Smittium culicis TaxID=133412 RepID=A0A1R1YCF6_9FUNG|nr:hypothetical protein AYI70_g1474 [Smittium culicis]
MDFTKNTSPNLNKAQYITNWVESVQDQDPEHGIDFPPEIIVPIRLNHSSPLTKAPNFPSPNIPRPYISITSASKLSDNSPTPLDHLLPVFPNNTNKNTPKHKTSPFKLNSHKLLKKYSEAEFEKVDSWGFDNDNFNDKDNHSDFNSSFFKNSNNSNNSINSILSNNSIFENIPDVPSSDNGSILFLSDSEIDPPLSLTPKSSEFSALLSSHSTLVKNAPTIKHKNSIKNFTLFKKLSNESLNHKSSDLDSLSTPTIRKPSLSDKFLGLKTLVDNHNPTNNKDYFSTISKYSYKYPALDSIRQNSYNKKPMLIKKLGDNQEPKKIGKMVYDKVLKKWRGNELEDLLFCKELEKAILPQSKSSSASPNILFNSLFERDMSTKSNPINIKKSNPSNDSYSIANNYDKFSNTNNANDNTTSFDSGGNASPDLFAPDTPTQNIIYGLDVNKIKKRLLEISQREQSHKKKMKFDPNKQEWVSDDAPNLPSSSNSPNLAPHQSDDPFSGLSLIDENDKSNDSDFDSIFAPSSQDLQSWDNDSKDYKKFSKSWFP